MPKLTYFPLIMDRWNAGTKALSYEQKGFYIDLLLWMFETGKPVKDADHAARILGCDPRVSRRLLADLCGTSGELPPKFRRTSAGLRHKLVDELIRNGGKIRGLQAINFPTDPDPDPREEKTPLIVPPTGSDPKPKRAAFRPPDISDVRAYCEERNNGIDPEAWIAHYQSNGWKVGRSAMKDWRAAVITWEKRRKSEQSQRRNNYATHANGNADLEALAAKLGIGAKPGETTEAWHMRIRAAATRAH